LQAIRADAPMFSGYLGPTKIIPLPGRVVIGGCSETMGDGE
jgi:hypothetical protein